MNRDHLLGWPPTLLALDPEPRKPQRTPVKPPVSQADEQFRREMDKKVTSALDAPIIQLTPEPVKPQIIGTPTEVLIHGYVWYRGGCPPYPGYWNACRESFALSNPGNGRQVYSYWDGEKWTMSTHRLNWHPDIKLRPRGNQSNVVWRPVEPK